MSPLQALDSDRLNFVAGWISHAVERTKFFAGANSFVDAGKKTGSNLKINVSVMRLDHACVVCADRVRRIRCATAA
jgi:hypothetical protein